MDILEIYQQYGVDYAAEGHEHCRPGWIQTDCPYCSKGSQHYRLGLNIRSRYYNCWACGPQRFIDTLMELTGLPFYECKEVLSTYEPLGAASTRSKRQAIKRSAVVLPKGLLTNLLPQHKDYLKKRGLLPDTICDAWGVKGIGIANYLQWRLFIPIIYDHEIISWTTRSISDKADRRYIAAAEADECRPLRIIFINSPSPVEDRPPIAGGC